MINVFPGQTPTQTFIYANCVSLLLLSPPPICSSRVLLGWYRHVETTQRNQYKEAWFQCGREQRLVRACFTHWQGEMRQAGLKEAWFQCGREQRLVRACFTHWQGEMRQAGLRQAALEQKLCQLSMWQTARALQYWRAATRRRAAQKRHSRSLLQQV